MPLERGRKMKNVAGKENVESIFVLPRKVYILRRPVKDHLGHKTAGVYSIPRPQPGVKLHKTSMIGVGIKLC